MTLDAEHARRRNMLAQIVGRPLPPDFYGSVKVNIKAGRPVTADVMQSVRIAEPEGTQ